MKILITGGLGWTAESIVSALSEKGYTCILFDLEEAPLKEVPTNAKIVRGDVANQEELIAAADGIHAIIHLAVAISPDAYMAPDIAFRTNVLGTYNVLNAARRAHTERVIIIGSSPVHIPSPDVLLSPEDRRSSKGEDHLYDLTKRLQEEISKDFSETFGQTVVTLKVGHIVDGRSGCDPHGRALKNLDYCRGFWVCRYDVAGACIRALEIDLDNYSCFTIIGGGKAKVHFNLSDTETVLGFQPSQQFERYSA